MKAKINHWIEALLGLVLGLLGFSGCDKVIGDDRVEYGQPRADYKLVGSVKDKAGKPIKGIRVVFKPNEEFLYNPEFAQDTLFSDAEGSFEKQLKYNWPSRLDRAEVVFEDIDGPENGGSFASKTLNKGEFEMKKTAKSSGNWYEGEFTITSNATLELETE